MLHSYNIVQAANRLHTGLTRNVIRVGNTVEKGEHWDMGFESSLLM